LTKSVNYDTIKCIDIYNEGGFAMFFIALAVIEDEQERQRISDIYEKYRHKCLCVALKYVKKQNIAEDIVGDTFVKIIEHKEKIFSLDCNLLPTYIVTIVKNKSKNFLKSQQKISDTSFEELEEATEDSALSIEEQVLDKMAFERLVSLVDTLDEDYRTVLIMKYIWDFSVKEIAETLDITQGNVKVRIHRAKAQLKKLLKKEVETNG
jgi:RNA polymerase sigma-70 factor (ECF subfamily)